ncbi:MAG TPA: hypothetical protein PKD53_12245 [Chloroflexaceae bacterium]|nr:hypothetical protein [Chloroflexaceae bacterium]
MNGDTFTCRGPLCDGASWTVERVEGIDELWQISEGPEGPTFLVAASEPICPRCAARLMPAPALKGVPSYVRHAA